MTSPLLSVVIPSKDRADYAVHCVRTLTRLADERLEIVLQDNSRDDALGRRLAAEGDARIRYEHRPGPLSVIDNCSLGMARARGEYVTLLGDDDGVCGDLIRVTEWASRENLDAVTPARIAWYVWPDVNFARYGSAYAGTLTVRPYHGAVTERDPAAGLRRSLRAAFQDLVDTVELPKLYYGLVHRHCLAALLAEAGSVFPGVSPDMSVAIGLTKYVRRFVSLDYPVFLPGSSAVSTAGAHARKEHVGSLADQAHLPKDSVARWPIEVPAVFAVQTVWAQSGLAALRATGRDDLIREFDLGLLHATCGTLNRGYWAKVLPSYWRATDAAGRTRMSATLGLGAGIASIWALRARYRLGSLTRSPWYVGEHVEGGHATIADAATGLDRWVAQRGTRPGFLGAAQTG
ncbi:MAG: glycosyltransferase [Candidatus Eisenbacteria bacterium]